jgi:hypothetical protein
MQKPGLHGQACLQRPSFQTLSFSHRIHLIQQKIWHVCDSQLSLCLLQILYDWQWSVGNNPLSVTSAGWKISQLQSDHVWRMYVVDMLDTAVTRMNLVVRHAILILCVQCSP